MLVRRVEGHIIRWWAGGKIHFLCGEAVSSADKGYSANDECLMVEKVTCEGCAGIFLEHKLKGTKSRFPEVFAIPLEGY